MVLGICASPRKKGNTNAILDRVLEGACAGGALTHKINLSELKFSPCLECDRTKKDGSCRIHDGMGAVYSLVEKADVIILASPIFFGSLSAQAKMMIDRYQCLWRAKYEKGTLSLKTKKGFFIAVSAAAERKFFDNAASIARNFFVTVGAKCVSELFCPGLEGKGDALRNKKLMKNIFDLGKKITALR